MKISNIVKKRHPRRCYFYCAYGFCKFGNDCQFRHEYQHSKPPAQKDARLEEENRALKKELFEVNEKHESLKVQLDNLMETQVNNEDRHKDSVANEIEDYTNKFAHLLKEKNVIIDNQARTIKDLRLETGKLIQENFKIKQNKCYTCELCDFETEDKHNLSSHKEINHETLSDNESEIEDSDDEDYIPSPTYHCHLCSYKAMYPDNVAFHYGEAHSIKMGWEEAATKCKR